MRCHHHKMFCRLFFSLKKNVESMSSNVYFHFQRCSTSPKFDIQPSGGAPFTLGSSIRNLRLIAVKSVLGEDRRSDSSNFGETLCDFFSRATKPSSPNKPPTCAFDMLLKYPAACGLWYNKFETCRPSFDVLSKLSDAP